MSDDGMTAKRVQREAVRPGALPESAQAIHDFADRARDAERDALRMTPADHLRAALRLLGQVKAGPPTPPHERDVAVAVAQLHAALAAVPQAVYDALADRP